ncbi:MAG: isoprenylcysteine carboxylmethyltransferase family protein [Nitrospirota bacterium]
MNISGALLALPFCVRLAFHLRVKQRNDMTLLGGVPSVRIWTAIYLVLLGYASYIAFAFSLTFAGWCGYFVLWVGIFLRIWAFDALKSNYNPYIAVHQEQQVVDTGPYRYLRHPLHTSLMLEMLGLALVGGSWILSSLVPVAIFTTIVRNREEERLLEIHIGESYRRYCLTAWDIADLFPWRVKNETST